jgi:hypothetical protein
MATDERQFKAFSQALAMTIIQTPLLNSFHQLWATLFDTFKVRVFAKIRYQKQPAAIAHTLLRACMTIYLSDHAEQTIVVLLLAATQNRTAPVV